MYIYSHTAPTLLLPPQIVKPKGKKLLRELLELKKKITRISQYSTIYTTVHTRKKNYVRGSMKNNYETSLHSHPYAKKFREKCCIIM